MTGDRFRFNFPADDGEKLENFAIPPKRKRTPSPESAEKTGRVLGEAQAAGIVTTQIGAKREPIDQERSKNHTLPMANRIWDALTERARLENQTAKYFLLKGLQMQGFPVTDSDLEDRRGSFIKEAARRRREEL